MLQKRGRRFFKTKLTAYILLLTMFGFIIFLINSLFPSQKSLFISPIGENNIDAKKIEKVLKDNNILFSQVLFANSSYVVIIPNNGQVKLSSKKDINRQIASLQRILRELTIEGKQFESIDFRFEEPILIYE